MADQPKKKGVAGPGRPPKFVNDGDDTPLPRAATMSFLPRVRGEVNFDQFEDFCELHCTAEEICGFFKISPDTLDTRLNERYGCGFSECFKKFSAAGKMSLRRKQYSMAIRGNVPLLIWLGKQYLGQVDRNEQTLQPHPAVVIQSGTNAAQLVEEIKIAIMAAREEVGRLSGKVAVDGED